MSENCKDIEKFIGVTGAFNTETPSSTPQPTTFAVVGPTLRDALSQSDAGARGFIYVCHADEGDVAGKTFAWVGNTFDRSSYDGAYYDLASVGKVGEMNIYTLTYSTTKNK